MKSFIASLGLVALVAITAACSSAAAQPKPSGPVDPNGPTIVAKDTRATAISLGSPTLRS